MVRIADLLLTHLPTSSFPPHLTSYVPGKSPFSTDVGLLTALASYLAVIFGIKTVMKTQQPYELTGLFRAHNIVLSFLSLLFLVLILEEIMPVMWQKGFFYAICAEEAWTPRMEVYSMITYYSKLIEFLDTIFLVLTKKPLRFLHVYHHSTTAILAYLTLGGRVSGGWTITTLNFAVHTVMYYYYFSTAGGAKLWWKKYLTTMQISQFVIDLALVFFGVYSHLAVRYGPHLPHYGDCACDGVSLIFIGPIILISYLGLFINFYLQTYKRSVQKRACAINRNGKAINPK